MTTEDPKSPDSMTDPLPEEEIEEEEDDKRYIILESPVIEIDDIRHIALSAIDEYISPPHSKMAHTFALSGLKKAAERDDDLNRILIAFNSSKDRPRMHKWGWNELLKFMRFQIETQNRVWLGVYGDPGTGKSVVAMFLMLAILASFDAYDIIHPILGFARSPSDTNDLLAEVQLQEQTVIVSYDESEEEGGHGSRKEQRALLQNARTNRVFRHSVVMCSIKRSDFGGLIDSCDILIRTLFKDMENKINWCLLYTKEFDSEYWDPEAIFGVPFDLPPDLLEAYTLWKHETQTQLTTGGGMLSASSKVTRIADNLIKFVNDNEYEGLSVSKLEEMVLTEKKVGGRNLTIDQQKKVAQRAHRLLDNGAGKKRPTSSKSYIGEVQDIRLAILSRMIERGCDPIHVKALEYQVFQNISQDMVALNLKNKDGIDASQASVSNWLKDGAFVAKMGYSFEDVYSRYLTMKGVSHLAGGGNEDVPDIVLFDDENKPIKVLSLKCLVDKRDVTSINRNEIGKKELALAKLHSIPLEVIYFDMWKGHLHPPQLDTGQSTFTFRRPEAMK